MNTAFFDPPSAVAKKTLLDLADVKIEADRSVTGNDIGQMRKIIKAHSSGGVDLSGISDSVRKSPFTVNRKFKKSSGIGTRRYLALGRIRNEKELLGGNKSLLEITLERFFTIKVIL